MKLSISNIGWNKDKDAIMYSTIKSLGFNGLEIAPTRFFPDAPYEHIEETKALREGLCKQYNITFSSMQSIWFGRQEKLFGTEKERLELLEYTKKSIDFAQSIGCENVVFGCPKNRSIPEGYDDQIAVEFFKEIGEYAIKHNTVIGIEANPPIYNTNYINNTVSAIDLIRRVNSKGFLLNLDVGTMIYNNEKIADLSGKVHLINHVHISEPSLVPIVRRGLHKELSDLLKTENYQKFVSIEMGNQDDLATVEKCMTYVKEIFE